MRTSDHHETDEPGPDTIGDPGGEHANDQAGDDQTGDGRPRTAKDRRRNLIEWAVIAVIAIVFAGLIRGNVAQQFNVSGHSMDQTLADGDTVTVNKLSYRTGDPERGDIVIIDTRDEDALPAGGHPDIIKRIVAIEGDTVSYQGCTLTINGTPVTENYLTADPQGCGPDQDRITIPTGHVYVLGDNRAHSTDSRTIGPIAHSQIIGRAIAITWPPSHWQTL